MCTLCFFFFFNDTATTEIYTLSLHDALPICLGRDLVVDGRHGLAGAALRHHIPGAALAAAALHGDTDRKSTRLNSSHSQISYAVFCLKKKKKPKATKQNRYSSSRWPSNTTAS